MNLQPAPAHARRDPGPRPGLLLGISVGWIPLAFLFDGVTVLMLPLRVEGSATDVGLISFLGLAIGAAVQPITGRLSDRLRGRVDRRRFAALAAVPALVGLWLFVGSTGMLAAIVGYVLVQTAAAAMQAGQQTLIPEHAAQDRRGRASGLKTAFDVGGAFLAFLVLGSVLAAGDLMAGAAMVGLAVVLAVAAMWKLVPSDPSTAGRPTPIRHIPPGLPALILARFLFLLGTFIVGRFLLLLVAERAAIPPERAADEAGALLALLTLTTAGSAVVFGWLADRVVPRDLMAIGSLLAAVGVVALVPAVGIAGLMVGGLIMSVGTAAFVTANWAATTNIVPPTDAGRLMGIANLGTALAAATAGLAGPVITAWGFAPALLLAAGASMAAIVPLARMPGVAARHAEGAS